MEQFTFFWKKDSPFSQWYNCGFSHKNLVFNCCEQAMMWEKAMLFGDKKIALDILRETRPAKHKELGRKVSGFDSKIWDANCKQIVYNINKAKFTQNKKLLKILMDTAGTTLVEASPFDKIWGIGLSADHPDASNRSKWPGKNWLGEVLTKLRNDLEVAKDVVDSNS